MPIEISTCVNAHIFKLVHEQPPVILFHKAAALLSYSYSAAYVARKRGIFPVRVRSRGETLVVFTSDLILYLQTGKSQAELSVPLRKKIYTARTGRPSNRESMVQLKNLASRLMKCAQLSARNWEAIMRNFRFLMVNHGNKKSIFPPASLRRLRLDDPLDEDGVVANFLSLRRFVRGTKGLLFQGYQLENFFLMDKKQGYPVATLPGLAMGSAPSIPGQRGTASLHTPGSRK